MVEFPNMNQKACASNCKFCYSLESKHWLIRKALLARVDLLMECTWQKIFVPASNQDYSSCFNFTQAFYTAFLPHLCIDVLNVKACFCWPFVAFNRWPMDTEKTFTIPSHLTGKTKLFFSLSLEFIPTKVPAIK